MSEHLGGLSHHFVRGALLVAAACTLAAPLRAAAQEPAPKSFYEQDFAAAPGVVQKGEGAVARPKPHVANPSAPLSAPAQQPAQAPTRGKKRRLLVSVTVNSRDKKHFDAVIQSVLKLHDSKLAFVPMVTHIGDYNSVTPEVEASLARRGIQIMESCSSPQASPPPLSPRWEILSSGGLHIAEGFLTIEPLINEWGDYDPKLAQSSASKQNAPEVKPGEF